MRLGRPSVRGGHRWAIVALLVAGMSGVSAIRLTTRDVGRLTSAASAGSLSYAPSSAEGFFRCEGLEISWRAGSRPRERSSLRVEDEATGEVLLSAKDDYAHFTPLWCGDILQNGGRAFGYSSFSGGAHCCTTSYVVLLDDEPRTILKTEGEGPSLEPKQLNEGGPYELVGLSDALAYFDPGGGLDSLSFVASPMLPAVFAYEEGEFVEATRRFPEVLESDLREAMADLRGDDEATESWDFKAGVGLRVLGNLALLGRLEEGLDDLRAGRWAIDATTSLWLVDSIPALKSAIDADFE